MRQVRRAWELSRYQSIRVIRELAGKERGADEHDAQIDQIRAAAGDQPAAHAVRQPLAPAANQAVHPEGAVTPVYYGTDREVVDAALSTIGLTPPEKSRIVRIKDTLHLREVDVSETCRDELEGNGDLELIARARDLAFDSSGNLPPFADTPL